jgi:hypothetical protein
MSEISPTVRSQKSGELKTILGKAAIPAALPSVTTQSSTAVRRAVVPRPEEMSITLYHLKRGARLGLPIGVAIGVSSFTHSHSLAWGISVGTGAAALGTVCQAFLEGRIERRLQQKGIMLRDAPVRPKLVLECMTSSIRVMELCREGLRNVDIRISRLSTDGPNRVVAITKSSFYSWGERITIATEPLVSGACELQISSVPWLATTQLDGGVNYTNVFLLSKYIKENLGEHDVVRETLMDTDRPSRFINAQGG